MIKNDTLESKSMLEYVKSKVPFKILLQEETFSEPAKYFIVECKEFDTVYYLVTLYHSSNNVQKIIGRIAWDNDMKFIKEFLTPLLINGFHI